MRKNYKYSAVKKNDINGRFATKISTGEKKTVRKSVVNVYFPHRGTGWAYYNDRFDLKVGDYVYVDGKLEGYRGRVTEVNYSFKIKISDYKKVIAVVDTQVRGNLYFAGSHMVAFDRGVIPYSKVLAWLKAPTKGEDYESGNDYANSFPLKDLSKMNVNSEVAKRGQDYYFENNVSYIEVNGTKGKAIVEGSEPYEIEFKFADGEISNLKCSCFCSGTCKHEFAAMLQLKETLETISEKYSDKRKDYFAAVSKGIFFNTVIGNMEYGKMNLE